MTTMKQRVMQWAVAVPLVAAMATIAFAQDAAVPVEGVAARQETPAAAAQTPPADAAARGRGRTVGPRAGGRAIEAVPPAAAERGAPVAPAAESPEPSEPGSEWINTQPVVRIFQDHVVPSGTAVREVVVIGGNLVIEGHVRGDAVVVAGSLRLGPQAVVEGDLVAVGSRVTVEEGALARQDMVVIGGPITAPSSFAAGGEQVVVGGAGVGHAIERVVPWVTNGLMLGRLFVPSLPWMWGFVAVVFFVYAVIGLLFERPVRACVAPLTAKPLSTFLVGVLVSLLTGPVIFILAISVVGIVVIPFLVIGLFVAGLFGRVAVARAIGGTVLAESIEDDRLQAARSFTIGFVILLIAYAIPVIGIVTYMLVGGFGLGAATMALFAGLRRENPAKPRPPRPLPSAPVTPSSSEAPRPLGDSFGPEAGAGSASAFASETPGGGASFDMPSAVGVPAALPASAGAATLLAMPKATFLIRAAAFFIDTVAVLVAVSMLGDLDSPREFAFFLLVYHVVFWTLKGTTLGGIVCNLRVIKTDGTPIGFSEAAIRGLLSIFSLAVLGLGAFWILIDADRQAWHDRFAGTYVVTVPRDWR